MERDCWAGLKYEEEKINLKEEWRDIKDYEGTYKVSNTGKIKSLDRYIDYSNGKTYFYKGIFLKPQKHPAGYLQVGLSLNGETNSLLIHRLVAEAFIENPNNLPEVNHKDENKKNNFINNLEWCTEIYNSNYGTKGQRISDKNSLTTYQYSLNGELITIYKSTLEAQRITGSDRVSIQQCCTNSLKTSNGFVWSYKELSQEEVINIVKSKKWDNKPKEILQIDNNGIVINQYSSLHDIKRKTGFDSSYISNCCRNKCNKAYGYKWVYKDKYLEACI